MGFPGCRINPCPEGTQTRTEPKPSVPARHILGQIQSQFLPSPASTDSSALSAKAGWRFFHSHFLHSLFSVDISSFHRVLCCSLAGGGENHPEPLTLSHLPGVGVCRETGRRMWQFLVAPTALQTPRCPCWSARLSFILSLLLLTHGKDFKTIEGSFKRNAFLPPCFSPPKNQPPPWQL